MRVTGFTDSLVSPHVVSRGITTAFSLCLVAMELSAQLEARSAESRLEWVPRDANKEKDAVADGRTEGFKQENRVHANVRGIQRLVLGKLIKAGEALLQGNH